MRLEILDKIHEGQQGIFKYRERAKGLGREIQDLVQKCKVCVLQRGNKSEPLITTPLGDRPWQIVTSDLFELKGVDYLIIKDYFSRYVEVTGTQKTTKSSEVIRALTRYLLDMGSRNKCDLTMVLSLTVQDYLTLLKNEDSNIAQVVLDFPKQIEKLSGELELLRIF